MLSLQPHLILKQNDHRSRRCSVVSKIPVHDISQGTDIVASRNRQRYRIVGPGCTSFALCLYDDRV